MENRRFEDTMSVEDLMKKPSKELLALLYIQAVKTNGRITGAEHDIFCLRDEMKDKIDWQLFKRIGVLLTLVISALTLPSLIINIIKFVEMSAT